jgi:hypothetical protein
MSNPVANVDIEDVLSSIRRLVSNSPETEDAMSRPAEGADRLVLTPSQRVDDTRAAAPPDRAASKAEATASWAEDIAPPLSDTDADTDTDGADLATEEAEPESIFPQDESEPESIFPQDEDDGAEAGAEGTPDPALDGIAAMFARHDAAAPTAWEPDGDDEDAFAEGAEAPALDWRDVDDTGEDAEPDRASERAETVERDWGTEAPGDAENAFALDDEAVLDEEALRDLVAEIVREELMGTLGERITRNVRKLVRREIHRALNSQDFD